MGDEGGNGMVTAQPLVQGERDEAAEVPLGHRTEREERLWKAIDALPEKLRIVVVLASIQGHEVQEVASLLGLPKGTVKSRLFLARQRLKEQLQCPVTDPAAR